MYRQVCDDVRMNNDFLAALKTIKTALADAMMDADTDAQVDLVDRLATQIVNFEKSVAR